MFDLFFLIQKKWKLEQFMIQWKESLSDLFEKEKLSIQLISEECLFFEQQMEEYLVFVDLDSMMNSEPEKMMSK
jgi:hypothetical protein